MADVKIRKLEDCVVDSFRVRAKKAGHRLEAELRQFLTEAARERRASYLQRLNASMNACATSTARCRIRRP